MVRITVYQNEKSGITGFDAVGHAGYAPAGEDIVCSAVSALVITCVNSVETLTEADSTCTEDEESGSVVFRLHEPDPKAQLLLESFQLGVTQIGEAWPAFADVKTVISRGA